MKSKKNIPYLNLLIIFSKSQLNGINALEIIKKDKSIRKNDLVIITAGLPFGNANMTNMIRLYRVGSN